MRRFIYYLIILGVTACKYSSSIDNIECQSKRININESEVELDFGVVADSIALLSHQFVIYNENPDTVRITRIDKSCGCTQLQLSNTVIVPNDSVYLNMNIELGSNYSFFERDVSIYTDQKEEPLVIYIQASRRFPERVIAQDFPLAFTKNLRLSTPYVIMGYIALGDAEVSHINILNNSDSEVSYEVDIPNKPSYISLYYNEYLKANEIGRIIIMIDLSKINNIWGLQKEVIRIKEISSNMEVEIPMEAIFVEALDKKDQEAPRLLVPITNYTINTSKKDKIEFCLKNIGKKTLYIRDIQISTNQKFLVESMQIDAGDEEKLTIFLHPSQKENIELGITTNDPIEPYKILRVNCKI